MSDTVPPIPPPFGANTGNPSSPIRAGNPADTINNTTTTNVVQNVVNENLPQLLDSRGGSHVTNVLEFDEEDFSRPSKTKDTKIVALRLKFNAFKALEGEKVNGTFTRLRSLLNDLENNYVSISQAEVNATFVNSLPRKWLSMNQTQRANNSIKNDTLAALYGKYNYKESLIDQIYESESTRFTLQGSKALIPNPTIQESDFDIEEDQRSSSEFLADLNTEFHKRALIVNQRRFYKRSGRVGSQKKPMDKSNENCFACGKLGHFQKECPSIKTSTPTYPSLSKSYNKPKFHTNITPQHNQNVNNNQKDYIVKYKGLKAKIDEESVSSDDEGVTIFKALMAVANEPLVGRADARSGQWVEITMNKVQKLLSITDNNEIKYVLDYTHVDLHYVEDQRKNLLSKYNSLKQDFSSCKTKLTDLKNTKALNNSFQNEITKLSLENESLKDEISDLKKVIEKWTSSRVTLDQLLTEQIHGNIVRALGGKGMRKEKISSKEVVFTKSDVSTSETNPEIPSDSESEGNTQRPLPSLPKLIGAEPSVVTKCLTITKPKQPTDNVTQSETSPTSQSGSSRSAKVKNKDYLKRSHNLISISQLCDANFKVLFTKTQGTIFNQTQEGVLIAPRRRDVYVIDMTSYNEESNACFFVKASLSVNWLWHKRLSHLNFKNINKLTKQNLVAGLPSLTFSKDKTCLAYEKGKLHRASFKTKRSFSINKCLHLLYMDLFGHVKPQSISHNKYTLVIVDEYSRKMENLNEVKGEAVNIACYTQNISIIVTRHGKTAYDVFRGRSPDISYFYVFGCLVHIYNHRDHLGKFDEKANDGFFLGYSLVAKAFRDSISPEEHAELPHTNNDKVLIKSDHFESTNNLEHDEVQISVLNEQTTETSPTPLTLLQITNPFAPQDRWSRDKHIELVNIIGEPLGGITTRSRIRDSKAASAHEFAILEAIRIFLAYAAYMGFMAYQMDVKRAFLNDKILEELYVQQPPGFESSEFPNHVCKLDKALYGLKQAPRAWYETLSKFLIQHKFVRGFQIKQDSKGISICQEKYVKDLLKKYDLADSASVKCTMLPPKNLGPDELGVSVNDTLYQANRNESHLVAVKRIFRYLKGTPNLGLWYPKGSGFDLKAYSDSDYAGCNLDRKSTSGAEAEYVAAAGCCAQVLWIKSQLADYDVLYDKVPIFRDNISAIAISNNPVLHSRTKHIDISCISKALTIQPSAMYTEYLKDFWYSAKVKDNAITFSLSHKEKPLTFDRDLFSFVIGLDYTKKFAPLPTHEEVKEGLGTLGILDEKRPNMTSVSLAQSSPIRIRYFSPTWKILMTYIVKCLGGNQGSHYQLNVNQQTIAFALCWDIDIDIAGILYNNLITKLTTEGKKGREKNITDATFKDSKVSEVPLTSHMRRVSKLPEKPLNLPSEDANIEATGDKSLSRTSVHPVSTPKAKIGKKRMKKKNPSSSELNISTDVAQTLTPQASESQASKAPEVPADISK
ncbi:retrovirus-related pol polyprotein from transposon TNT 1-94 [Tanacetum coccineum]|uniref:Retrovirus-related pol polyprotein from transposon TNT 1-94 n=1 Tax=Tanacetum coccineum TaxID=301880 RepID=A0ABQ5DYD8_9ASTR